MAVCLYLVFKSINLHEAVEILAEADWRLIIIALGLYFGVYFIHVRMWQILLDMFDVRCNFWDLFGMYFITLSAGFFLPSTVGSYVPVMYLRQKGHPIGKLVFTTSLNLIFQIIPPVVFSAVAVYVLPPLFNFRSLVTTVLIIMVGLVGLLTIFYFRRQDIATKLKSIWDKLLFKWVKRFKSEEVGVDQFYIGLHHMISWRVIWVILLAFTATLVGCTAFYILGLAVSTRLSLWSIIVCLSLVTLVTMIPISIGGIGVREGSLLFLFTLLGETSEKAVVLSLLLFLNITFWRVVGLPFWLKFSLPSVKSSL